MATDNWEMLNDGIYTIFKDVCNNNLNSRISINVKKIKDDVTGKYKLRIDFKISKLGDEEETVIQNSVECNMLMLDAELLKIREYGLVITRHDAIDIRQIIESNFLLFEEVKNEKTLQFKEILKEIKSLVLERGTEEYIIKISDFNKEVEELLVNKKDLMDFRKWLEKEEYIKSANGRTAKIEKKSHRVLDFNINKLNQID